METPLPTFAFLLSLSHLHDAMEQKWIRVHQGIAYIHWIILKAFEK